MKTLLTLLASLTLSSAALAVPKAARSEQKGTENRTSDDRSSANRQTSVASPEALESLSKSVVGGLDRSAVPGLEAGFRRRADEVSKDIRANAAGANQLQVAVAKQYLGSARAILNLADEVRGTKRANDAIGYVRDADAFMRGAQDALVNK